MALVKPLYIDAEGFPVETSPTGDAWAIGGLTLNGNIDLQGTNKLVGVADGTAAGDGINLAQLDQAVITGGTVKEALLHCDQVDNAEGILAAGAFAPDAQPVSGDSFVLTDGTTTRTYTFGAGGDVTVTIGGTLAISLANLAAAIAGDGSGIWSGTIYTANLNAISSDGVVIPIEDDNDGVVSRMYGTWATQANALHVNFLDELEYTSKTLTAIGTADPTAGSSNFGIRRTQASLTDGEIHTTLESDELKSWDASATMWVSLTGSAGIPDATSASGGGVKGKVTADSDKGLVITTGILEVVLEANGSGEGGLAFDSGQIRIDLDGSTLQLQAAGVSVKGLPSLFEINGTPVTGGVTAANLNTLTDNSNADALHTHSDLGNPQETVGVGGVTIGDPIYYSANDEVKPADNALGLSRRIIGIADATVAAASPVGVAVHGDIVTPASIGGAPAAGLLIYLDTTSGVTQTRPVASGSHLVVVGRMKNATQLFVGPIQHMGLVA